MKIIIEGTKEEIEALMTKVIQPVQIAQPVIIQPTTPKPW